MSSAIRKKKKKRHTGGANKTGNTNQALII
jgi:hypothetical protein